MSLRLAHYSCLSRYSPGTPSCGTSCVRTSPSSESSASSTPFTTSASNAFPCSSNSSTLSESAPWTLDNPCKSPDCSPVRTPSLSNGNDTVSTLWLFPRTCSLNTPLVFPPVVLLPPTFVFAADLFGVAFCFANFFLGVTLFIANLFLTAFFIGATFLPAVLFDSGCFFLVFFLVAMREVYHRLVDHLDVLRAWTSGCPEVLVLYRKREWARCAHEHRVLTRFRYSDLKEAARDCGGRGPYAISMV